MRDTHGKELSRGDDQNGTSDPGLDFEVPAEVDKIVLALRDLHGRGRESVPHFGRM